ncbi:MAG: double-strand break repair helicase AddA [Alphaproteobacteria bacterium]
MRQEARSREEILVSAQRAATEPKASVWVTANAGSGKTHVLVDRVCRLMLAGTPAQRILCLTFTRAAAAEMANRLFERLGQWTTLPRAKLTEELERLLGRTVEEDDVGAARRLFARALETPGGLKIQTIHAFCESLLARFPLEADVPPHFELMDERTASELLEAARDHVLEHARNGGDPGLADALERMVAQVDDIGFGALMNEIAQKRGRFRRLLERHGGPGGVIAAIRDRLGVPEKARPDSVIAEACARGFDEAGLKRACAALLQGSDKDKERAADLRAWLESPIAARARSFRESYARVFLTKEDEPRKESGLITKAAQKADGTALPALLAEQARVHGVVQMLKSVAVAQSSADLVRLAAALLRAYDEHKARAARLDYDDLIERTRDLLTRDRAAWVLYKLDGGIDHILIDEAQDTSPEQWEVVAALAEEFFAGLGGRTDIEGPRTLFVVGDEKQSIFSFQGADLAVFERMARYFKDKVTAAGETWKLLDLVMSFRSTRAVLDAVDHVFARDPARDGVVVSGGAIKHFANREGQGGVVEIWPTVTPSERPETSPWDAPLDQLAADSPETRLADRIASCIEGWLGGGEMLESGGRKVRPGDIMILVRRRNAFFEEMVRCLKARGVPVAGTDRMTLTEQLAVMDLVALGQFLLLPEDNLTLATVLKSPLIGFTEEELFDLAHGRSGTLWAELKARAGERAVFGAAHAELSALLARADFVPPFEFYAWVLGERGGRKRLLSRLGPEAGDPIDEFLALALAFGRSHTPSLQGFLHWLAAAPTQIKRDLEQGRDEVRVMTVHGAKGLESEIVFLPDTCAVPESRQDERILWPESGAERLPLWPAGGVDADDATCAAARMAERGIRMGEYRRLLYVAMTRARDRLYVCGWETKNGKGKGCWYDLISDALGPHTEEVALEPLGTVRRLVSRQSAAPDEKKRREPPLEAGRIPAWALTKAPLERKALPLAPSRPREIEPAALSPLAKAAEGREEALARGRLVHLLLELLPDRPPSERMAAARAFLARPVHGLDQAAQAEIARETLAVLEDPRFGRVFAAGSMAEVALAGRVKDTVIAGQVDRLLVSKDEVLVVDYKTNRPLPETDDQVPAAYLRQMAAYRALLAGAYPGRAVSCVLLWTVGPRLMALRDDVLDMYAP